TNGQMTVSLRTQGVSLMAPNLRVYNGSQVQLYTGSGTGYTGSTLSYTRTVTAGQTYYFRVDGANTTSFRTGAYVLSAKFGTAPLPAVAPPNMQVLNGNPISIGGSVGDVIDHDHGHGGHHDDNEPFDGFSASPGNHGSASGSAGAVAQAESLV